MGSREAVAQSLGGAGTIKGIVADITDAPMPSAAVELSNPVTGFSRIIRTAGATAVSPLTMSLGTLTEFRFLSPPFM